MQARAQRIDPIPGALNSALATVLNYHHHKAYRQNSHLPWLYLSKYVDDTEERPSFLLIWLRMWEGPSTLARRDARASRPEKGA